ncbi:prevent-host-death family protein (plasmid) [Acidiphilium multivorum AIU301]|uniref:Antitoxin n=1 Tax=Acidiphilium multivorum (strain DSM 11245 / JCM 8867 / NBRC 100883 / AIU 301) TaxID=926570 RepID=F0J7V9_ACIMA|nr:type II toxin-antitoxin system prevent-host-death family antitoxin [Acidiphilium multivorum]BAJ83176.1 prevent-host-death family protein [Acidiphilium multivorum AIU301]GAN75629.1 prevent-host-death protein [Acidiphilium multivorum AIU301]
MPRLVSAADANRQFSEILGQAVQGETVIITRRGAPVAQLTPLGRRPADEARDQAWDRLLATLEKGLPLGGHRFDRDSLYDR